MLNAFESPFQARQNPNHYSQNEIPGGYMFKRTALCFLLLVGIGSSLVVNAKDDDDKSSCKGLPSKSALVSKLVAAAGPNIGGLFNGARMWGAIVNRDGELCTSATNTSDPTQVWPGSQAIAKSKAYTANAFSLDTLALSTALLYTFTQPGHSLWSLGGGNPFNPDALATTSGQGGGGEKITGGMIFFGGGVPLYSAGKIIGGLGVSGDTSCADHEVAKTVRDALGLNPPGGKLADDITYSGADGASPFTHPLCLNTKRNGTFLGTEANATGY
jgi:uncharacterized protein GlcG (DUF336 family)